MVEVICVGVIGGSVVAVALFEDKLISKGLFVESDTLQGVITGILTFVGMGSSVWFLWEMVKKFV